MSAFVTGKSSFIPGYRGGQFVDKKRFFANLKEDLLNTRNDKGHVIRGLEVGGPTRT